MRSEDRVLVDAGPLIALLDADDAHHARCVRALRGVSGALATVWPAVTEALHLLSFSRLAQDRLLGWVESGTLEPLALEASDMPRVRELMAKYSDLPMDFADAAIVRCAEREGFRTVFTVDRDFKVIRPGHVRAFRLLP